MRISILLAEPGDVGLGYVRELLHQLAESGFLVEFANKTLLDLGMNPTRVADFVKKNPADAWVVIAASREVLEWFGAQDIPVFSIFGRIWELPIAGSGPDKVPLMRTMTSDLIRLGHTRIVLINRLRRRHPIPGNLELSFFDELEKHGIVTSSYNMPEWKETPEDLDRCFESLFQITPPTAFIFDEVPFFVAAMMFMSRRNLRVPEDVSMICTDADPSLDWCHPAVSHLTWDARSLVRRVMRWSVNVGRGVRDVNQPLFRARMVPGATVGPAPKTSSKARVTQ